MNPYKKLAELDNCIFRVTGKGVIVNDKKVLLVRDDPTDKWSFPGGGIDYGENAEQAVIRELKEEVGLQPEDITNQPKLIAQTSGHVKSEIPRVNIYFEIETDASKVVLGDDATEIGWFSAEELKSVEFDESNGDISQLLEIVHRLLDQS
jgi:8-oxo-dGTP diphosphatase